MTEITISKETLKDLQLARKLLNRNKSFTDSYYKDWDSVVAEIVDRYLKS